jgi:glucosamine 6-phosphate synthetase-like amidotransferase/phosphosugar isomerase protein
MTVPWFTASCLQLVIEVLKKLEGAYALLIKSTHYPGQLVACKRGSPLIFGIKVGRCILPVSLRSLHWCGLVGCIHRLATRDVVQHVCH